MTFPNAFSGSEALSPNGGPEREAGASLPEHHSAEFDDGYIHDQPPAHHPFVVDANNRIYDLPERRGPGWGWRGMEMAPDVTPPRKWESSVSPPLPPRGIDDYPEWAREEILTRGNPNWKLAEESSSGTAGKAINLDNVSAAASEEGYIHWPDSAFAGQRHSAIPSGSSTDNHFPVSSHGEMVYNFEKLTQTASNLRRVLSQSESTLDQIRGRQASLAASAQGQAAQASQEVLAGLSGTNRNIIATTSRLIDARDLAVTQMRDTEQQWAQRFSEVFSRGGLV